VILATAAYLEATWQREGLAQLLPRPTLAIPMVVAMQQVVVVVWASTYSVVAALALVVAALARSSKAHPPAMPPAHLSEW